MPAKSGMWATSIRTAGSLSRSFISGTRLCPPAMSFPAPPAAASFASASSSEVARSYSNAVGIMREAPGPSAAVDDAPQLLGRSIMSTCRAPNTLRASTAALTMHGVEPIVPASPTPLAPSGFTGVGVTVLSSSNRGKSLARGMA